jgi:hypothetical protein
VNSSLRSLLLKALAVLILVNAAAGVAALATGGSDGLGEAGWRVISTTITLTAAGFALLPCVVAWESGRLGRKPWLAAAIVVCNVAAVSVIIAGIWSSAESESFWQPAATLVAIALTLCYGCLLSLVALRAGHAWLRLLALALAATLAFEVVATIWNEDLWSDAYIRALAITAILMLTASILLPVVQRLSRQAPLVAAQMAANFCPVCGAGIGASTGSASCPGCGARFRIEFLSAGGAGA